LEGWDGNERGKKSSIIILIILQLFYPILESPEDLMIGPCLLLHEKKESSLKNIIIFLRLFCMCMAWHDIDLR
jgi:hypothetical protein